MTPEQRRELERLIDEARYAMLELGLARNEQEARAAERTAETYRTLRSYLDEITDYSTAEAVSGS